MITEDMLTKDQHTALEVLREGRHCLLLGEGGVGKSALLELYIRERRLAGDNVICCAPTGIAALNLSGGCTIHRMLGVPPRSVYHHNMTADANKDTLACANVIVMDEVSMCRLDLFDLTMRTIIQHAPIDCQIVLVGDFHQLPPVITDKERPYIQREYPHMRDGFAFEGDMWDIIDPEIVPLDEVIRQSDEEFVHNLRLLRDGNTAALIYFNQFVGSPRNENDVLRLEPLNAKVRVHNMRRLNALTTPRHKFDAMVSGDVKSGERPAEESLVLREGCRVMALANHKDGRYANGSMGKVIGFSATDGYPLVDFGDGVGTKVEPYAWEVTVPTVEHSDGGDAVVDKSVGSFSQIPLRLAYAVTIHKAQGQTFDRALINPACFGDGQLYVALSRVRSTDGLYLTKPIQSSHLKVSNSVRDFYGSLGVR